MPSPPESRGCRRFLSSSIIKFIIVISIPILMLPLPLIVQTQESRCGYVLIVMAVLWTTEALPLSVTALVPLVLLPLMGVVPSKEIAPVYLTEIVVMALGGFIVAVAIEKCNLHKRIALKVLLTVGSSVPRLMLGFMLTCMCLSMWISNTAATTMMLPIVEAVLEQLKQHMVHDRIIDSKEITDAADDIELHVDKTSCERDDRLTTYQFKRVCKAMHLSICYSATCGGSATLIGTSAILITKASVDRVFSKYGADAGMTFPKWMLFSLPMSIICMLFAWLWLQFHWFGFRRMVTWLKCSRNGQQQTYQTGVDRVLQAEYTKLGPMRFAEKAMTFYFIVLALLWLTRDPEFVPGWASLFRDKYVGSSVPPIFISILLFMTPSQVPFPWDRKKKAYVCKPLMDMDTFLHKVPWNVVLLLGGGLALAKGCEESGLSYLIGIQLRVLGGVPVWLMVAILTPMLAAFTEITSNTPVVAIIMPVLSEMARMLSINPLQLMLPGAVACNYAFMLPVATPPNAVVFSAGHLRVIDMVKSGVVLNILCLIVVNIATNTWGKYIFHFDTLPPEFVSYNMLNSTISPIETVFSASP